MTLTQGVPTKWIGQTFVLNNWLSGVWTPVTLVKANSVGSEFYVTLDKTGESFWIPREALDAEAHDQLKEWDGSEDTWAY